MSKASQTQNLQDLLRYNALDTVATARVYSGMLASREWNTPRVQGLYKMHADLARIAAKMHTVGFLVDVKRRQELADQLLQLYNEREAAFLKLVNIPGMRCMPNDMRALLFKRHEGKNSEGAIIKRFSLPDPVNPKLYSAKTGAIKVDQGSLLMLLVQPDCTPELTAIIEAYWQAEGAWKARSTYVVSESVSRAIGPDGRLRANWNSCGTDTGRFACSQPNLMNLSEKKDEDGGAIQGDLPSMRSMYRAAHGNVLVHADYSQLELRVMRAVSGDAVLGEALATGDVYSADARDIFKLPEGFNVKKLKPAARKQAKIIHLGFQYGAGDGALYGQALEQDRTLSFKAVQVMRRAMLKRYHGTVEYWKDEHARVQNCGYSESRIMGRRRTYPREPPITETANYPIQSTASDVANLAMIELDKQLTKYMPKANIVVQLHDAIDLEVPEKLADRAAEIMREAMEQPFTIGGQKFTFPVEIKQGVSWDGL